MLQRKTSRQKRLTVHMYKIAVASSQKVLSANAGIPAIGHQLIQSVVAMAKSLKPQHLHRHLPQHQLQHLHLHLRQPQ